MSYVIGLSCGCKRVIYGSGPSWSVGQLAMCRSTPSHGYQRAVDVSWVQSNVTRCIACIWDPDTGKRLRTCRDHDDRPKFSVGQWVKIARDPGKRYAYAGIPLLHAVGIVRENPRNDTTLTMVEFVSRVTMWVTTEDLDPSEDPETLKRRDTYEQDLRDELSKLKCLLGDIWPYVHTNCTIQTLRDRVLAAMKGKP